MNLQGIQDLSRFGYWDTTLIGATEEARWCLGIGELFKAMAVQVGGQRPIGCIAVSASGWSETIESRPVTVGLRREVVLQTYLRRRFSNAGLVPSRMLTTDWFKFSSSMEPAS